MLSNVELFPHILSTMEILHNMTPEQLINTAFPLYSSSYKAELINKRKINCNFYSFMAELTSDERIFISTVFEEIFEEKAYPFIATLQEFHSAVAHEDILETLGLKNGLRFYSKEDMNTAVSKMIDNGINMQVVFHRNKTRAIIFIDRHNFKQR